MASSDKIETPMMKQYNDVRQKLPKKTLLFFRLGNFYELFGEDAKIGSEILSLTLTHRSNVAMAGVPYHAANSYFNKILNSGYKVAICEQLNVPQVGELVKRGLTRILTPGTVLEESQIESTKNRYIGCFNIVGDFFCAAWIEVSTGELQISSSKNLQEIVTVLTAINPVEVILPEYEKEKFEKLSTRDRESIDLFFKNKVISEVFSFWFEKISAYQYLKDILGVLNLNGYGIEDKEPAIGTACALLKYVAENLCCQVNNLQWIRKYVVQTTLLLDSSTIKNLEIFYSIRGTRNGSLLYAIDRTATACGARLLEKFLIEPTLVCDEIKRRQNCINGFILDKKYRNNIVDVLKKTCDLHRIITRLQNRMRNPRELGAVKNTLSVIPELKSLLFECKSVDVRDLTEQIENFDELYNLLSRSLNDSLPIDTIEGGFIKEGFCAELDRIRSISSDCQQWLNEIELAEQQRTGIKNLRIKYNGAFGYFIEVTKSNLHLVPSDYVRRQTTVNAERYITDDLKKKEREILNASQESITTENRIFDEILSAVSERVSDLQVLANVISQVDVFQGLADLAEDYNYCCPEVSINNSIEIVGGRHPVVEQSLRNSLDCLTNYRFVENDTQLDCDNNQIALITGPNMAGKSTYIRQVALITILAHIGSWVPAQSCKIGIVDKIFSRIGAGDDISTGNSTFMVEMVETANILNNATNSSLIILDEIGRGTSTYDGLSIAWSVIEYLHGSSNSGPKTLFATHYHEITQLDKSLPRLKNYQVVVKEAGDSVVFVRQVVEGAADKSYGIHVAKLAGLPNFVINRAKEVLLELENEGSVLQLTLEKSNRNITKLKKAVSAAQIELL